MVLAAAVALTAPAQAAPAADMVEARLLPGWRAADGTHIGALEISLRDGWKTYWRAPGDAGIPPRFDWRGSRNLGDVGVVWPVPRTISQNGVRTIGYADSVVLPLRISPQDTGRPVTLKGAVEMGICKDVCVPVSLKLSHELPADDTGRDPRIVAALAARPFTAQEAGVADVSCRVSPIEGGLRLRAEIDLPRQGRDEIAVIETDNPAVWVAQAQSERRGRSLVAETELYHVDGKAFALDRSGLRVTVLGDGKAVDIQGCPAG
jgi:DsbC/DsbD-like thiol-disulfide interchange protein